MLRVVEQRFIGIRAVPPLPAAPLPQAPATAVLLFARFLGQFGVDPMQPEVRNGGLRKVLRDPLIALDEAGELAGAIGGVREHHRKGKQAVIRLHLEMEAHKTIDARSGYGLGSAPECWRRAHKYADAQDPGRSCSPAPSPASSRIRARPRVRRLEIPRAASSSGPRRPANRGRVQQLPLLDASETYRNPLDLRAHQMRDMVPCSLELRVNSRAK